LTEVPLAVAGDWGEAVPAPVPAPQAGVPPAQAFPPATGWD